jgi:hypothetical protein
MSHTCHVRYVYTWRYDGRHVHILTTMIWGGVPVRRYSRSLSIEQLYEYNHLYIGKPPLEFGHRVNFPLVQKTRGPVH